MTEKKKKIVVIGGGTGTYTVLKGLKNYNVCLSAIVSMTDSGGSNRVLRDEFGILPTSDIRQCIVALASGNCSEILRELFTYRYSRGTGIAGMTFGNLFMAALADIYGSQEKAIDATCKLLDVKGQIIPVTLDNCHLIARYENGCQVLGEHNIDEPDEKLGRLKIVDFEVIPKASLNPRAEVAIGEADLVIFGPGDLYTSIICNLLVGDIVKVIKKSKARKVFIINLMTKFGQTNNFSAKDHLSKLEAFLGKGVVDYCLVNKNSSYQKPILALYSQEKSFPVVDDLGNPQKPKVIREDFISREIPKKDKADKLLRSLIRHDPEKLARVIISLL